MASTIFIKLDLPAGDISDFSINITNCVFESNSLNFAEIIENLNIELFRYFIEYYFEYSHSPLINVVSAANNSLKLKILNCDFKSQKNNQIMGFE